MNIKKLFATLAGVSLFAQTVVPFGALAATYSQELQDAYDWAYGKGVTTMSPIDNANMYGAITRAEMAKMLSVYAKEVLGKELNTSAACTFSDIDSVKGDLHDFIIESCQLGIMGQGITAFRPYDTISRAEFGTALSRVLWGSENEGGTPYYAKHLDALKANGIMNQIANAESTKEIRGYVMLMLMRSEANAVDCEDPVVALACLDPEADMYKECPAACREDAGDDAGNDEVVKSGDLSVKATANNGGVILAAGVSDMDTLTFKTSEEVEINKVVLERYGYSKNENVKRVWLEDENGVIISNVAESLNSKAQATLTLKKDYRKVDGTLNATIVIEAAANAGNTIGFKVVDVTSSAKNVDVDDYKPYTYSVVDYDGADLILTTRSANKTYNWEAGESYEVAKFKLRAPSDSAINVTSFTLTDANANEIEYDDYLESVKVTVAGKEVKSSWNVNKDDELVINLSDVELAAKDNSEFVVSIELADGFDNMGKAVNFYIAGTEDISATDAKTNSRVLVKALATYQEGDNDIPQGAKPGDHKEYKGTASDWYYCTFEGGKIKITSEKLGNVEASEDSTDIVIAKGEITTSQTIKAVKGAITVKVTNSGTGKVVNAMRLEIAGDEYEGTPTENGFSFPAIDVDRSGKIRLLVDTVESGKEGDYATFKLEGLKNFKYEDSKTTGDIAGSLNISRLTLTPSKASLTNSISSDEVEFKAGESSDEKTIFKGEYTSKKRDINLNKFTLSGVAAGTGAWKDQNEMTVYLYIDGQAVADSEYKNGKATDTFTNVLVEAGKSVSVELKAQVDAAEYVSGADVNYLVDAVKFTLILEGEDENGNDNSGLASKATAKVSVVKKGTPEIEAGKAKKTVLLRGSDDAIAEFIVKPSGSSSIDLESVSFTKPANVACSALRLEGDLDEDLTEVGGRCEADGFVEAVNEKGITVKVVFDDEPSSDDYVNGLIEVAVKDLKLNDTDISETFNKAYAEAVLTFSQSGDGKSKTTYVLEEVKGYKTSAKISNIRFFNEAGEEFKTSLASGDTVSAKDDFTINNGCQGEEQIMKMEYTVTEGNLQWTVVVNHDTYSDYFKTKGSNEKLTVYDNGKDCTTATNNKVSGNASTNTGTTTF